MVLPDTVLEPIVPVRDRCLSVAEPFEALLPDGGLRRGHVVGCSGPAAMSLATGLLAHPVQAGSWLAVVGVPMLGLEAVAEMGVPLERVVGIEAGAGPSTWAERVAAAIDGFELVLTRPPAGADRYLRKVGTRLQARGAVLVPIGPVTPGIGCDIELTTSSVEWVGADAGAGHLMARRAQVRSGGRRVPRPVEADLLLPGPDGRIGPDRGRHDVDTSDVPVSDVSVADVMVLDRAG